jgi:hypothetical protein
VKRKKPLFLLLVLLIYVSSLFLPANVLAKDVNQHLIIVNKATNQLAYYNNQELVKVFPVGTGKTPSLTTEGTFSIVAKFINPYYRSGSIAGGSPQNPLGVRWLGLSVGNTGGSIYGIHGTNNPGSIGGYVSAGCIRMYNEDVIWLYDQVTMGTAVKIINEPWDLGPTILSWQGNRDKLTSKQVANISVLINDSEVAFDQSNKPFLVGEKPMLPLRLIAEKLSIPITYVPDLKFIILQQGSTVAGIDTVSGIFYSSEGSIKLSTPVTIINGVSFVSLEALQLFNLDLSWEEKEGVLIIN